VGAALLALACGALLAARDPGGAGVVVWIEVVFVAASTAEIARKLVVDEGGAPRVWVLLGALVVGLAVLLWAATATRRGARRLGEADERQSRPRGPHRAA